MNIIDVLIVGIILLGALQGYRKGLLTGLANFVGGIAGFVVAATTYSAFFNWLINTTPIKGWIEPVIYRWILPVIQSQVAGVQESIVNSISSLLPPELYNLFSNNASKDLVSQENMETLAHTFAGTVTEMAIRILSFIAIFFFIIILVHLVVALILKPLGILGGVANNGGGLIFGALGAIVLLSVAAGLLTPLLDLTGKAGGNNLIQKAALYPYLLEIFHGLEMIFSAHIGESINSILQQALQLNGDLENISK